MQAIKGIISQLSSLLILRNHNSPRNNKTIIHKINKLFKLFCHRLISS